MPSYSRATFASGLGLRATCDTWARAPRSVGASFVLPVDTAFWENLVFFMSENVKDSLIQRRFNAMFKRHIRGLFGLGRTLFGGVMQSNFTNKLTISILALAVSGIAYAGPEWDEGETDAGALPGTSQVVSGSSGASTQRIIGKTTAGAAFVGAADLVDMYVVKTGSSVAEFSIKMPPPASSAWPARLTIFKKVTVNCCASGACPVTLAKPIATVARASSTIGYPILAANSVLVGTQITLGSLLTPNTEYLVACSGKSNLPGGLRDDCGSGQAFTFFPNATEIGVYGANSLELLSHITQWTDPPSAEAGTYEMPTTGMYPLPASSCATPMTVSGSPAEKSFDFAFAPAITGTVPCATGYVALREFFFKWNPGMSGPATVATCGLTLVDTAIEVFQLDCSNESCTGTAVACNDQCGISNASAVTFTAQAGRQYLVRLTKLNLNISQNVGSIRFTVDGPPPSGDVNGDGIVNGLDLGILLGQWGTSG